MVRGEEVTEIVDSTGMSFGRASESYEKKYGKKAARTPWRKVHLPIDLDMNVDGIAVTDTTVSDTESMEAVLPGDVALDRVIADGAYYSIDRTRALSEADVTARDSASGSCRRARQGRNELA